MTCLRVQNPCRTDREEEAGPGHEGYHNGHGDGRMEISHGRGDVVSGRVRCQKKGEARTEAGEVGELRRVIRHGPHEPVRRRLPHRVQQPARYVQAQVRRIRPLVDVDLVPNSLACIPSARPRRQPFPRISAKEKRAPPTFDKSTPMCGRRKP